MFAYFDSLEYFSYYTEWEKRNAAGDGNKRQYFSVILCLYFILSLFCKFVLLCSMDFCTNTWNTEQNREKKSRGDGTTKIK